MFPCRQGDTLPESHSNKTSTAIGMGLDTDQRRAEPFGGGENSCVIIQPSVNPAKRNVTAVGRSYEGRIVFFVSMIAFTFWLNGQSKKLDTPLFRTNVARPG